MAERSGFPVLGIDMGATNLRAALVDEGGAIVERVRLPLAADPDSRRNAPAAVAGGFRTRFGAVGLAVAGIVRDGVMVWSANLGLGETDFAAALTREFDVPSVVVNDARAAGLAEAVVGAGKGKDVVLTVTVGTGIGGAITSHGELFLGSGSAGEFGHMVVEPDGPECFCGRFGCLEVMAGGRALRDQAAIAYPHSRRPLDDLVGFAEAGDTHALAVVARAAGYFAVGLDNLIAAFAPEVIVLGGGVMARGGPIVNAYCEAGDSGMWRRGVVVTRSTLGDDAGLLGAAIAAARQSQL